MSDYSLRLAGYIAARVGVVGSDDPMRLQKLLYYAQGWSLAWTGRRLFEADFEAWVHGPVLPNVWKAAGKRRLPEAADIPAPDRAIVDAIVDFYGDLDGRALSVLTHGESPWVETRGDLGPRVGSNRIITADRMRRYFVQRTLTSDPRPGRPVLDAHTGAGEDVLESGSRVSARWRKALDELADR